MLYRIRQFWNALYPKIKAEELEWAWSLLPPHSISLFRAQSLPEQRHALDVALDLHHSGVKDTQLLIAALLHDCGKIKHPLKLWERTIIVLLQKSPQGLWDRLRDSRSPFSAPLRTAQEHPQWGAELASEIGLSPQVVELIREHHTPRSQAGYLLYAADNRH